MVESKVFLQIQSIKIVYPNIGNMIPVQMTKGIESITRIKVCLISWMNFDYKENGGKKSFSCKSKASISGVPMLRT